MTTGVTLYHIFPSLCSQKVRLALVEKGVAYRSILVDIGPAAEQYEPWYLRLNPKAVVPTLVHNSTPITDSAQIIRYINRSFPGPDLVPEELASDVEAWIDRADHFPLRALTFQRAPGWITDRMLAKKVAKLKRYRTKHPDLADLYTAKLRDIQGLGRNKADPSQRVERLRQLDEVLSELEKRLSTDAFVVGDRYTLADVMWTVFLTRLEALKLADHVQQHPHLSAYYHRMQQRPSYSQAELYPRFGPQMILRILRERYPVPFYVGLIGMLVAACLAIWAMFLRRRP